MLSFGKTHQKRNTGQLLQYETQVNFSCPYQPRAKPQWLQDLSSRG